MVERAADNVSSTSPSRCPETRSSMRHRITSVVSQRHIPIAACAPLSTMAQTSLSINEAKSIPPTRLIYWKRKRGIEHTYCRRLDGASRADHSRSCLPTQADARPAPPAEAKQALTTLLTNQIRGRCDSSVEPSLLSLVCDCVRRLPHGHSSGQGPTIIPGLEATVVSQRTPRLRMISPLNLASTQ
jgi:hypothetical protein